MSTIVCGAQGRTKSIAFTGPKMLKCLVPLYLPDHSPSGLLMALGLSYFSLEKGTVFRVSECDCGFLFCVGLSALCSALF
jgi:hypothetical protein